MDGLTGAPSARTTSLALRQAFERQAVAVAPQNDVCLSDSAIASVRECFQSFAWCAKVYSSNQRFTT